MVLDGFAATRKIAEWMTMSRQDGGDPFETSNLVEVRQVIRERIATHETSDVWRDRGQHVIARK
ncbi:unannotated protein [freshwater metagenome]|uniref:Unannotated protein n=1 Tax=freshwater metagenome TaxID=449393 RepID=A0A6J6LEE5_9ZZZZ